MVDASDTSKLRALAHYIAHECRGQPGGLHDARLNLTLWLAEARAFREDGKPITGETYVKRQDGIAPRRIGEALDVLEREGAIGVRWRGEPPRRSAIESLREPASGDPASSEHRRALAAAKTTASTAGVMISTLAGWHDAIRSAAYIGEEIPIFAVLAANEGEVTPEVIAWANEGAANRAAGYEPDRQAEGAVFFGPRAVVLPPAAAAARDGCRESLRRFGDAYMALEWRLVRAPDHAGAAAGRRGWRVCVQAADKDARTPEIWALCAYDARKVVIHGLHCPGAE